MEAGIVHLEHAARLGAAVGTVLHIGVVGQLALLFLRQFGEVLPVGGSVLITEHHCPHQQVGAGVLVHLPVGLLGHIVIVGKAHGNVIFILVQHKTVQLVIIGPAVVGLALKVRLLFRRGDEIFHTQQVSALLRA